MAGRGGGGSGSGSGSSTSSPTSSTPPPLMTSPHLGFHCFPQKSPQGNPCANMWGYPQGGFVNFINQNQFPVQPTPTGENFHLIGLTQSFNPLSVSPQTPFQGTPPVPPPPPETIVNLDENVEDVVAPNKAGKKRHWTHQEEVRLASAWLNTSKDNINGTDKKSDTFRGQISEEFNRGIEQHLTRDINQLKIHWGRLSKLVNEFNGYWSSVTKLNKSGYSDDLLMEEAQKLYEKKHGKPFALIHWWKELKDEPKWKSSVSQLDKDRKKILDVDDVVDVDEERPMGRAAAKAQRKGKRKVEEVKDGISMLGDNLVKITEMTQERKKEREKVTEAQLEISRNQLRAAKLQQEGKLIDAYAAIMVQDTSQMSEEEKASRLKAIAFMERKLWPQEEVSGVSDGPTTMGAEDAPFEV